MGIIVMSSLNKTLNIVSFNVESPQGEKDKEDTKTSVVGEDIQKIKENEGPIHLWALQEVKKSDIDTYRKIINKKLGGRQQKIKIKEIYGKAGWQDRLVIYYDENSLELIEEESKELFKRKSARKELAIEKLTKDEYSKEMNCWGHSLRYPLLAIFRFKVGPLKGERFWFVNNHLKACDDSKSRKKRKRQANHLKKWVKLQDSSSAIILAGDFNFGVRLNNKKGEKVDSIFKEFMKGNAFKWAKPKGKGHGYCYYYKTGVLDFIFLAGVAKKWSYEAKFLFEDGNYCDKEREGGSDHRPLLIKLKTAS